MFRYFKVFCKEWNQSLVRKVLRISKKIFYKKLLFRKTEMIKKSNEKFNWYIERQKWLKNQMKNSLIYSERFIHKYLEEDVIWTRKKSCKPKEPSLGYLAI